MSADNYFYVCQNPVDGRWHYLHRFASNDMPQDDESDLDGIAEGGYPHPREILRSYPTKTEALEAAFADGWTEYGVQDGPWPWSGT